MTNEIRGYNQEVAFTDEPTYGIDYASHNSDMTMVRTVGGGIHYMPASAHMNMSISTDSGQSFRDFVNEEDGDEEVSRLDRFRELSRHYMNMIYGKLGIPRAILDNESIYNKETNWKQRLQ